MKIHGSGLSAVVLVGISLVACGFCTIFATGIGRFLSLIMLGLFTLLATSHIAVYYWESKESEPHKPVANPLPTEPYLPKPKAESKPKKAGIIIGICIDNTGVDEELVGGIEYEIVEEKEKLVVVRNEQGDEKEYLSERFRCQSSDVSEMPNPT